jgi:hypothetical protein
MSTADQLSTALGLQPLPREGGCYRETYRSPLTLAADALAPRYLGVKAACTPPLIGQAFFLRR